MIAASELALPDACGKISNNYPVSTAGATDFTPCAHLKIFPANASKCEKIRDRNAQDLPCLCTDRQKFEPIAANIAILPLLISRALISSE